jgi:hypothetical protein
MPKTFSLTSTSHLLQTSCDSHRVPLFHFPIVTLIFPPRIPSSRITLPPTSSPPQQPGLCTRRSWVGHGNWGKVETFWCRDLCCDLALHPSTPCLLTGTLTSISNLLHLQCFTLFPSAAAFPKTLKKWWQVTNDGDMHVHVLCVYVLCVHVCGVCMYVCIVFLRVSRWACMCIIRACVHGGMHS